MNTAWPQLTYAALAILSLGFTIAKHGQPQGSYNIGTSIIAAILVNFLLYMGGFWSIQQ